MTEREARLRHLIESLLGVAPNDRKQRALELEADPRLVAEALAKLAGHDAPGELDSKLADSCTHREPRSHAVLPAGTRVGAYELLKPVSVGGSSSLWIAQGPGGRATVRLLQDPEDSEAKRAFDREVQLLEAARGPHVVPLLDSGSLADGTRYLVLEWIEGCPFDLRGLAGCSVGVLTVLRNALQAVGDLHLAGFVHGAIRPANLIVTEQGEVYVLDFGSAAKAGEPERVRAEAESGWSAPEWLSGERPDPRADVFSLARVLEAALDDDLLHSAFGRHGAKEARALFAKSQDPSPLVRPRDANDLGSRLEIIISEANQRNRFRTRARFSSGLGALSLVLLAANSWKNFGKERRAGGESAQSVRAIDPGADLASLRKLASSGDPAVRGALADLAARELDDGNLERAENLLQIATESQPDSGRDSKARAGLVRGWWRLGRPQQAAEWLNGAGPNESRLIAAEAIRQSSQTLADPEDRDIEFASWLGQEFLARRDFVSIRELVAGFPSELSVEGSGVRTVLSAFARLASAPHNTSDPTSDDPAFLQLDALPPETLHPVAVHLLLRWADRLQKDHGDEAASRWWSLAESLASDPEED